MHLAQGRRQTVVQVNERTKSVLLQRTANTWCYVYVHVDITSWLDFLSESEDSLGKPYGNENGAANISYQSVRAVVQGEPNLPFLGLISESWGILGQQEMKESSVLGKGAPREQSILKFTNL